MEIEALKLDRDQLATREEANRTKISDQSKLLYAEAFGSINLGKDDGDTGAEDVVDLRRQAEMLTEQMADKDNEVESLRLEVEKLQDEVKQARSEVEEADGYNFTMVEESKNLVEEAKNHARELEQKDAVIRDCRAYIDSLTDQVNARSEELEDAQEKLLKFDQIQEEVEQMQEQIEVKQSEVERLETEVQMKQTEVDLLQEKLLNSSQLQARDEEIAGLQAELALSPRDGQPDEEVEEQLKRIHSLEKQRDEVVQDLEEEKKRVAELEKEVLSSIEAQQSLKDELSSAKSLASQLEEAREEAAVKMADCNKQITDLRQDLNKRNEQVMGFVQKLKEIKVSMKQKGRESPELEVDTAGSTESLDWDYEGILEQSSEFIQRLVGEEVADTRLDELEREKIEREETVKKLELEIVEKDKSLAEMRSALESSEVEQEELMTYLNTRLGEIRQLKEEMVAVKESKVIWEQKLQKSLTAIQGFVTENQKLQEKVAREEERRLEVEEVARKLKDEISQRREEEKTSGTLRGAQVPAALSKQRVQFAERLAVYRGRYNGVLEYMIPLLFCTFGCIIHDYYHYERMSGSTSF